MDEPNAEAADAAGVQPDSPEVGNQEKVEPDTDSNVSEDAKTQDGESESEADKPADEQKSESDDKKDIPQEFHKHPAWRRQQRNNRRLKAQVEQQSKDMSEMANLLKEVVALQKGEDYTPEQGEDTVPDMAEVLDQEMDNLIDELSKEGTNLTSSQEQEIMDIANEYGQDIDGKQIPLSPKQAYKVYLKLSGGSKAATDNDGAEEEPEGTEKKVSTRSSKTSGEKDLGKIKIRVNKTDSLDDVVAKAKGYIKQYHPDK
jgi:hypothetical protein